MQEDSNHAIENAVLGGALGALGGAAGAYAFTASLCHGRAGHSMCGLVMYFVVPVWTLGVGTVGALAGGFIARPPLSATWTGVVLGILAGDIAMSFLGSMARDNPAAFTGWFSLIAPLLVIAVGGILGGALGNRLWATLSRKTGI